MFERCLLACLIGDSLETPLGNQPYLAKNGATNTLSIYITQLSLRPSSFLLPSARCIQRIYYGPTTYLEICAKVSALVNGEI